MKNILTVFKKEVLDTFRDKRTLITSIIIPLVLLPAIIMVTSRIQENAMEDSFSKKNKNRLGQ
jgi:sodium transport system permease protein